MNKANKPLTDPTFQRRRCRRSSVNQNNLLVRTFYDYLQQSQIHGYAYILKSDRPYLERIAWACLDVAGVSFTAWLIVYSYMQLIVAPTVTSQRTSRISVQEIPFPAVAICSGNRLSRAALHDYAGFM